MEDDFTAKRLFSFLLIFNIITWGLFIINFSYYPKLLVLGGMAYLFGLRHAFDADHIAAIDNTTRKLVQDGKKPIGVGFFFSLGHSSVVILLSIGVILATKTIKHSIPFLRDIGNLLGTLISAFFLLFIGIINIFIFKALYSVYSFYRESKEDYKEELHKTFDELLSKRGLLNNIFRFLYKKIDASWKMYVIGFLFGLGFDTATEIAILGISVALAQTSINILSITLFPMLFAAGMTLMDSFDSYIMTHIYTWTNYNAIKRLSFNLIITGTSIFIALFVGILELLQIATAKFIPKSSISVLLNDISFGEIGIFVVITMLLMWLFAFIFYKKISD